MNREAQSHVIRSAVVLVLGLLLSPLSAARAAEAAAPAPAAPPAPVTAADPADAIVALRTALVDCYNRGDIDGLLSHLDGDVVVTWQNAEICRGPQAVKDYYNKMMTAPDKIVAKATASPKVDDRHVYGDWAVSWGNLHDEFELTDGRAFKFDSRFTATVARRGEVWKVTSFHASVDAFNNPILMIAAKKAGMWGGIIAGVIGLLAGVVIGMALAKRKRAAAGV